MQRLELLSHFRSLRSFLLFCFCSLMVTLGLGSCQSRRMHARLEYVDPSYLASNRVNTPNIWGCCFSGEQVVVHWHLPSSCKGEFVGKFTVRFKDHSQECVNFDISKRWGHWTYRLLDTCYCQKGGVLSYKAEIFVDGACVAETRHHLFAEPILLNSD